MHFTRLDLIRGLAALTVVVFHYPGFWGTTAAASQSPFYWVLWPLMTHGDLAVSLFWILSGVVFAKVYGDRPVSGREFFFRRLARLYPLHLATLLIMAALELGNRALFGEMLRPANDLYHFGLQLIMASNWGFERDASFNFPIWSVSIEILAYAAFFVFLKLGGGRFRSVLVAATTLGVAAILLSKIILSCIALFFIGMLAFHVARALAGARFGKMAAIAAFVATLGFTIAVALSPLDRHLALTIAWLLFPTFLLAVTVIDMGSSPVAAPLQRFGASTYAIYLIHIPLLETMRIGLRLAGATEAPLSPWFFIGFIALVVCAAQVVLVHFEEKSQDRVLEWAGYPPRKKSSNQASAPLAQMALVK